MIFRDKWLNLCSYSCTGSIADMKTAPIKFKHDIEIHTLINRAVTYSN